MAEDTTTTTTPTTTAVTDPLLGTQTGQESSLSSWVGDYVTNMLGKGQALGDQGYNAYAGPLTAGTTTGQQNAFQGIANLTVPTGTMGAFTPQTFTADTAQQYMNPYLENAMQPQIDEVTRQANIQRIQDASRMTQAGAYGGSRQAILEAEGNRNLMGSVADITGAGYANAYDKALAQFNAEQDFGRGVQNDTNSYGLSALQKQADLGGINRGITAEGVAADKAQFDEERLFPYKQTQYMQSLLQGLPIASQSYSYTEPGALGQAGAGAAGVVSLIDTISNIWKS